jgi:hypothetical protein
MMELMNDISLELNEERRREVVSDTMRVARAANRLLRESAAVALVTTGQWLSGDTSDDRMQSRMRVGSDCV